MPSKNFNGPNFFISSNGRITKWVCSHLSNHRYRGCFISVIPIKVVAPFVALIAAVAAVTAAVVADVVVSD